MAKQKTKSRRFVAPLRAMSLLLCVPLVLDNPNGFLGYQSMFLFTAPVTLLAVIAIATANRMLVPIPKHLLIAVSVFLAAAVFSLLLSRAPLVSVFGSAGRASGLASLVLLIFIGWAGVVVGRQHTGYLFTRRALVAVGLAIALGSLLQGIGAELPGYEKIGSSGRLLGPMGSASQLGAIMLLFLASGLSILVDDRESTFWRKVGGVSFVPIVAVLVLSGSRAAWIGAVVGVFVTMTHPLVRSLIVQQYRVVVATGVAIVLGLALAVPATRDRVFSLFDPSGGTIGGRADIWRAAAPGWWERPLQGFGLDQARAPIMRHLATGFETTYGTQETVDRAHSLILDQLLWGGVIGLGAFVCMLVVWWRLIRVRSMDAHSVVLFAGLFAFGTHLMFNFPVPEIDRVAWLIAGLLVGTAAIPRAPKSHAQVPVAVLLCAVVFPLAVAGTLNLVADRRLQDAVTTERSQDLVSAVKKYESARDIAGFMPLYRESYARVLARTSGSVEIIEAASKARLSNSADPILIELELRARAQVAFASRDTAAGSQLIPLYEKLCAEYPSRVPFQVGLALVQLTAGDIAAARKTATQASERAPKDPAPEIVLALIEKTAGNSAQAEIHSKEAARRGVR